MKSKKVTKSKEDTKKPTITLYGEVITIGPGTVPTSPHSAQYTSIKKIIAGAKEASRLGLFQQTK